MPWWWGRLPRAGHRLAGSLAVRLVKAARWPVTRGALGLRTYPGCCQDGCEPWHSLGPAGRYGALAAIRILATVRDGRQRVIRRACRAARVVAIRTRRAWFAEWRSPARFWRQVLRCGYAPRLWRWNIR